MVDSYYHKKDKFTPEAAAYLWFDEEPPAMTKGMAHTEKVKDLHSALVSARQDIWQAENPGVSPTVLRPHVRFKNRAGSSFVQGWRYDDNLDPLERARRSDSQPKPAHTPLRKTLSRKELMDIATDRGEEPPFLFSDQAKATHPELFLQADGAEDSAQVPNVAHPEQSDSTPGNMPRQRRSDATKRRETIVAATEKVRLEEPGVWRDCIRADGTVIAARLAAHLYEWGHFWPDNDKEPPMTVGRIAKAIRIHHSKKPINTQKKAT